jgi:hypothetical protein
MMGRDALPDVLGALRQAVQGAARGLQHLPGAADQLPGHQERDQDVGEATELAVARHQVVLVAAVGVARRVGVVLEQEDVAGDALVVQAPLGVDEQALQDALAGAVVPHEVGHGVALGGGVLGVRTDVQVQSRSIAEEHVAGAAPTHHPAEQITRHLVRRQPPLTPKGAGDAELGFQSKYPPIHTQTLPGEHGSCLPERSSDFSTRTRRVHFG